MWTQCQIYDDAILLDKAEFSVPLYSKEVALSTATIQYVTTKCIADLNQNKLLLNFYRPVELHYTAKLSEEQKHEVLIIPIVFLMTQ